MISHLKPKQGIKWDIIPTKNPPNGLFNNNKKTQIGIDTIRCNIVTL